MTATSTYMLVFRIVHIMAAVAWAGAAFLFTVFIEPAANELGPQAGPLMQNLTVKRKVGEIVTGIAAFAVVGGWFLYWRDWHAFPSFGDWIGTSFGLWLTIGGVAATTAFVAGTIGIPPNLKRLTALGEEVAAAEGPPPQDKLDQIHAVQERMSMLSRVDLVLIVVAVFSMATARYW